MPLDAFTYMFLARELDDNLAGGRIEKIAMNASQNIMLYIHTLNGQRNLLFSMGVSPRCYISKERIQSLPVPVSFLMHLRKHIGGGIIKKVECEQFERILKFNIISRTELGYEKEYVLIAELMGKYSNLLLTLSDGTITEALKHIPLSESHPIVPGIKYLTPSTINKINPLSAESDILLDYTPSEIVSMAMGLSQITAKEIQNEAKSSGINFSKACQKLLGSKLNPQILKGNNGLAEDFTAFRYSSVDCSQINAQSLSEAMDSYFLPKEKEKAFKNESNKLKKIVSAAMDKQKKKLGLFLNEEASAKDYENEKKIGELITANIFKIKNGDNMVIVTDWESGEDISIRLTEKTPAEDAQKHFARYHKKKRTLQALQSQITDARKNLEYLESIDASIDSAVYPEDLSDIYEELVSYGLATSQNERKKKKEESLPRVFQIKGFTILIGKNNLQNDKITKQARGEDLWLHVQGIHGSHVVIKCGNTSVPQEILETAAKAAAFFSKARLSENVPVDYTKIKYVHKPKGAAPGKVEYFSAKTIYVDPSIQDLSIDS